MLHAAAWSLQHRLTDTNNTEDSPFDFTEENYKIVKSILAKYPKNYKQVRAESGEDAGSRVGASQRRVSRTRRAPTTPRLCAAGSARRAPVSLPFPPSFASPRAVGHHPAA